MNARKTITLLFALLLMLAGSQTELRACDRSDLVLDSLVFDGTNYHIYATACFGGGVTGVQEGAADDTRTFAFAFYTPGAVSINLSSFDPLQITSDTTGCTQFGLPMGSQGSPFFSQQTLGYSDFGCPNAFTCVTSTSLCGNVHSQCQQFVFAVDLVPDSIRLFGVEGDGNPVDGCYPNPDMLLDFTVLPVVWGGFEAEQDGYGNQLGWTTLNESNNSHFQVQRSGDGVIFENIGNIGAAGNAESETEYGYFDPNPLPGQNHYRISQVDLNGSTSQSKVVTVNYTPPMQFELIGISSSSSDRRLWVRFASGLDLPINLEVFSVSGKQLIGQNHFARIGENTLDIAVPSFSAGLYFVRIIAGAKVIEKKVLVL